MTRTDVLILGAGAAGLFCAAGTARRGRRTLVLEHASSPGKKVLISGGGRCNFTNLHAGPDNFLSANPHFAKSALARYTPRDFAALVEKHGVPYHEKTLGQLFCDRTAHDILNLLLAECAATGARIQLSTRVLSVARLSSDDPPVGLQHAASAPSAADSVPRFVVETTAGPIAAASLIVATGGLSIPKMGATSLGYDLARQFQHPVVEPRPALVPLVLSPQDQATWCDLAGVSAEVIAGIVPATARSKAGAKPGAVRPAFREKMLITHRGLSGPAMLQISSYWQPGQSISLDLAPGKEIFAPLLAPGAPRQASSALEAVRRQLPSRLADRWLAAHLSRRAPLLSNTGIATLEDRLHHWQLTPAGTEGFAKAEVTAGGVSTEALDARTMQSRLVHGLYFIGEVVDVTGWLGGYNFQWAWASAHAAAQSA
jgi:predicted Rossmann fold flavoprotein